MSVNIFNNIALETAQNWPGVVAIYYNIPRLKQTVRANADFVAQIFDV